MFNKSKKYIIPSIIFVICAIFVNAFIVFQSCLNGSESTEWSSPVVTFFANIVNFFAPNTINDGNMSSFSNFIRKAIGHFGLFGFDGVITTLAIFFSICDTKFYKKYCIIKNRIV